MNPYQSPNNHDHVSKDSNTYTRPLTVMSIVLVYFVIRITIASMTYLAVLFSGNF